MDFYFPRYIKATVTVSERQPTQVTEDLTGHATILVVDDEAALRTLLKEILNSMGYKVLYANSGKQALKILETESVDLLLSDVIMPGMGGYELAAKVQKLYPGIKIQMASGFADEQDPYLIDDELHKMRLQKPFSSTVLLQKIKILLWNGDNALGVKLG